MWFDSHCHLNLPGFDTSPELVWSSAMAAGIADVFVPGTDPMEWSTSTIGALPGVRTGVGLHPFTLEQWSAAPAKRVESATEALAVEAQSGIHAALGECGWDKPLAARCPHWSLERQTAVVETHLRLAVDLQLPIVLHVVQAHGLALEVLRRYRLPRGGIIHCFSGNAELVSTYCRMGFCLGYGTQLLRRDPKKALAALRVTPRSQLVVETDAPFPSGSIPELPNSPIAVVNVAKVVASTLSLSLEAVAELTFTNALRVFGPGASGPTRV